MALRRIRCDRNTQRNNLRFLHETATHSDLKNGLRDHYQTISGHCPTSKHRLPHWFMYTYTAYHCLCSADRQTDTISEIGTPTQTTTIHEMKHDTVYHYQYPCMCELQNRWTLLCVIYSLPCSKCCTSVKSGLIFTVDIDASSLVPKPEKKEKSVTRD